MGNDQKRHEQTPPREGDVIGISDANAKKGTPAHVKPGGGHPAGIDVREHATGLGDVPQRSGATGTDMGAGGEGTHIASKTTRPKAVRDRDDTDE
jgi:hypothetical protein